MSLMVESMCAEPFKSISVLLTISVLAIGTLASALLIADFIDRSEWRDYNFDRGGTCETIQCGNLKGARIDSNQWP